MKFSIIVPAFNEEKLISGTLAAMKSAIAGGIDGRGESELIVVDNNSTDATARLSADAGARVVFEPINQISRARNAGAAAATGDWLIFIDADSYPSAALLGDVVDAALSGRIGGGGSVVSPATFRGLGNGFVRLWNGVSRTMGWAAGSFIFCRADVFREIGGFSLDLYASEELDLSRRLKRALKSRGLSFTILTTHPLETSPRKLELYSTWEMLALLVRGIIHPIAVLRDKRHVYMWYDGRR